jgi:hypothetical protein
MEDLIIEKESSDEVLLFDVLPSDLTDGTAYHYYQEFPWFDEEVYYLLQNATRNDMPSDQCIELCQEIVDNKNKALLENFGGGNLFECEVVLDDYNADSNIPEQLLCDEKTE